MSKNIIVINASPKKNGNTSKLVEWFVQGCLAKKAKVEIVEAARLKAKVNGCTSCRVCQTSKEYKCVIKDEVSLVLEKMAHADVVVMATPLYFFSASAQLKMIIDRMFSLYKWDNQKNTFTTPLKGKTLVLLASAYEDIGLDALERPLKLTAEYTKMRFVSLLVANAGVSGQISKVPGTKEKAYALGKKVG